MGNGVYDERVNAVDQKTPCRGASRDSKDEDQRHRGGCKQLDQLTHHALVLSAGSSDARPCEVSLAVQPRQRLLAILKDRHRFSCSAGHADEHAQHPELKLGSGEKRAT